MDDVVEEVKYKVEVPLKEPERFEDVGMSAPKGVLFYGPPGTGKTYLAKIVANQVEDASFYSIRGPELSHELVGGTARKLRGLFENAQKNPPAIIFFDEIDSMAPRRDKTKGCRSPNRRPIVVVNGWDRGTRASGSHRDDQSDWGNRPSPSATRSVRTRNRVPRPSREGRREILNIHKPDVEFADTVSLENLVEKSSGWTGAHIESLFEEIGEILLKENGTGRESDNSSDGR